MNTTKTIWDEYNNKLLSFIRKRVNNDVVAEDILQDIFVKIHLRINDLEDKTKLESWLYQLTRNSIIDHYRTKKNSEELPEWLTEENLDKNEQTKQELEECIEPMIALLPEKYRDAVFLSELKGINQKEVAREQGISLSGAKSRVQRGRILLKGLLYECCEFELNKNNQVIDYKKK